jgi:hypothetical protein
MKAIVFSLFLIIFIDNGIPIDSFYDDPKDRALLQLMDFLPAIKHEAEGGDVRPVLSKHFNTKEVVMKIENDLNLKYPNYF